MKDGEPWFVARDVAVALDYPETTITNIGKAIQHVPDEWRGRYPIPTPSGVQEMLCLSEPGLYFFLARSDKPKALPFQKLVAGRIMPQIRKTGSFQLPAALFSKLRSLPQLPRACPPERHGGNAIGQVASSRQKCGRQACVKGAGLFAQGKKGRLAPLDSSPSPAAQKRREATETTDGQPPPKGGRRIRKQSEIATAAQPPPKGGRRIRKQSEIATAAQPPPKPKPFQFSRICGAGAKIRPGKESCPKNISGVFDHAPDERRKPFAS